MQMDDQELLEGGRRTLRLSEELHRYFSPHLEQGRTLDVSAMSIESPAMAPRPIDIETQRASVPSGERAAGGRPVLSSLERPAGVSSPGDDGPGFDRSSGRA